MGSSNKSKGIRIRYVGFLEVHSTWKPGQEYLNFFHETYEGLKENKSKGKV